MSVVVQEITCKTALSGSGGHYRLNPYWGCEHACAYCYATYLRQWRRDCGPWGTWVQVKTNVARVLEKELTRRRAARVFLSTACDVYQPVEEHYRVTRQCLSVLALAAQREDGPAVTVVTKSDRVLRDRDVLGVFPAGKLTVVFSLTTADDALAAVVEPGAAPPSRRLAALATLSAAGLRTGAFICPVLPHVTEHGLEPLLAQAQAAGAHFATFGLLNYLDRQVGQNLRETYRQLGPQAQQRLAQAHNATLYKPQVWRLITQVRERYHFPDDRSDPQR